MKNRAPIANAGGPYTVLVGVPLVVSGAASADDVAVVRWHWVLPDGTDIQRTKPQAALLFDEPGTVTVKLIAIDATGASGSATTTVTVQAGVPAPTPVPGPGPSPGPTGRALLGGWRLAQEFARGAIAIDFARMKLWLVGHAQRNEIVEYDLPPMGTGSDAAAWPRVDPVRVIPQFWDVGYANGLVFWRGKLWVAPRVFYDTAPPDTLTLFAQDGETVTVPLPRQRFSGFVKLGPGQDPLIGCGGYESGQGSVSGPTVATLAGEIKLAYGWPATPTRETWNQRAPREANYWPVNHQSSWVAWEPQDMDGDGVVEGRWASDRVYSGGLVLPEGVVFWPYMGTGVLDYRTQLTTFSTGDDMNRTYEYRYDQVSFALQSFVARPDLTGPICGQELGPDGRVYLSQGNAWASGAYQVDPIVKVFGG